MKASPVEYEAKRCTINLPVQEITHMKFAMTPGSGDLFAGPLYRHLGNIRTRYDEAAPCQPQGIITGSATNVQSFAGLNGSADHCFGEVEIRPADIPVGATGRISFMPIDSFIHCGPLCFDIQ